MAWLIGSSIVVLGSALASALLHARGSLEKRLWWVPAAGLLALPGLGFGLATSGIVGSRAGADAPQLAASSIAWPGSVDPQPASTSPPMSRTTGDGQRVAPVSSLVDGLEARLERSPDDPQGWALLATSYAFIGNHAGAEEAIAKAVALGVDEAALRERVEAAGHPQQSGAADGVAMAIGR